MFFIFLKMIFFFDKRLKELQSLFHLIRKIVFLPNSYYLFAHQKIENFEFRILSPHSSLGCEITRGRFGPFWDLKSCRHPSFPEFFPFYPRM